MATSKWEFVRKRVLPVVFLGLLLAIAFDTCGGEPVNVEVSYEVGEAGERLRGLRVDYFRGDEPVGYLERELGPGGAVGPVRHVIQLLPDDYRARIELRSEAGARVVERDFEVGEAMSITFPVADAIP